MPQDIANFDSWFEDTIAKLPFEPVSYLKKQIKNCILSADSKANIIQKYIAAKALFEEDSALATPCLNYLLQQSDLDFLQGREIANYGVIDQQIRVDWLKRLIFAESLTDEFKCTTLLSTIDNSAPTDDMSNYYQLIMREILRPRRFAGKWFVLVAQKCAQIKVKKGKYNVLIACSKILDKIPIEEHKFAADLADFLLNNSKIDSKIYNKAKKALLELHNSGFQQTVHFFDTDSNLVKNINFLKENCNNNMLSLPECIQKINIWFKNDNAKRQIDASIMRIKLDETTWSSGMKLRDFFVLVVSCILQHKEIESLKQRLREELIEMDDTCTSGNALRLLNVFSGFGLQLQMSFNVQMFMNFKARFEKAVRELSDVDFQANILYEMTKSDDAPRPDFQKFLQQILPQIQNELYEEYVLQSKCMNEDEFINVFRDVIAEFEK